jgi:hypothetical protein
MMPWRDWQFWVVTAVFLGALVLAVRPLLPRRRGGACGGCASGATARRGRKVRLTVGGEDTAERRDA